MILLLYSAADDTGTITGWAIATDNPTWTEAYDDAGGSTNTLIAGAYALRTQSTFTGDATWNQATSETWGAVILAITENGAGVSSTCGALALRGVGC